jgi:hypothetical protein
MVAVGLGAMVAVMNESIGVTTGALLFGTALAGSIFLSFWTMRTYKCPDCGSSLFPPQGWWYQLPGKRLLFRCTICDTEWDFGHKGHEG